MSHRLRTTIAVLATRPSPARTIAAPATIASSSATPAVVIALAAIAAAVVLGSLLWGLARWRAWQPRWWEKLSHALAEAGYRAEATWAEFADWVRLGR